MNHLLTLYHSLICSSTPFVPLSSTLPTLAAFVTLFHSAPLSAITLLNDITCPLSPLSSLSAHSPPLSITLLTLHHALPPSARYGEIVGAGQGRAPPVPDKADLFVMLKTEMRTRHTQSLRKFDKRDEDKRDSFARVVYMKPQ
jgi:hypothetical protein